MPSVKDTLGLALILWEEGATVRRCIEPFLGTVSEIVIGIDEKTEDNTEEEIDKLLQDSKEKYPDIRWEVFKYKWEDDFSKARNCVIEKMTADWTIFPDGHEILRPESIGPINKLLELSPEEIWLISPYIHMDLDEEGIPASVFPRPIIFRNHLQIKFDRSVHNILDCPDACKRLSPDINFVHESPSQHFDKRNPQRSEMNVRDLEGKVEKDPGDTRSWFYLGNTYAHDGKLDKAIAAYSEYLKLPANPDEKCQVWLTVAAIHISYNRFLEARSCCFEAMKLRWDRAEGYFFLGVCAQGLATFMEAIHWYRFCSTISMPVTAFFLRGDIYSFLPWEGMMECYNSLSEYAKASEAADKILEYRPNDDRCKENARILKEAVDKIRANEVLDGVELRIGDNPNLDASLGFLKRVRSLHSGEAHIYGERGTNMEEAGKAKQVEEGFSIVEEDTGGKES